MEAEGWLGLVAALHCSISYCIYAEPLGGRDNIHGQNRIKTACFKESDHNRHRVGVRFLIIEYSDSCDTNEDDQLYRTTATPIRQ